MKSFKAVFLVFAALILLIFAFCSKDKSTGPASNTVTDIDGNVYRTVTIGTQVWMAENLKVTHYRNVGVIPELADSITWDMATIGAYCNYDNDTANVRIYGRLYNWYAIDDSGIIAPTGWHVPSDSEWQVLIDYLGGDSVAGGKMKEADTLHWHSPNVEATDESGFTALPAGFRTNLGYYGNIYYHASYWTGTSYDSSQSWCRDIQWDYSFILCEYENKKNGFSVRCVKD